MKRSGILCIICLSSWIVMSSSAVSQNNILDSDSILKITEKGEILRKELINGNIGKYVTDDPVDLQILGILEKYKESFDRLSIGTISSLISPEFKFYYTVPDVGGDTVVMVQDRSEYLDKRSVWIEQSSPARDLVMSIQSIQHYDLIEQIVVTAATKVQTKHFEPMFLEVFVFHKSDGRYQLFRHMVTPLYPKRAKDYRVEIYFANLRSRLYNLQYTDIRKDMLAIGPDNAFKKYIKRLSKTAPGRAMEQKVPIIVIFRDPPPEGATIEIVETQFGGRGNEFYSYQSVLQLGNPYYFLANEGWWGWGYRVRVKVSLNGEVIAKRTLRMPR